MQGKTINGFELQQLIGVGGMAEVWQAENKLGKKTAVKLLLPKLCADDTVKSRFYTEAKLMVELNHPNIRQVYDFGNIDDRPAIVMEYLEGGDLKTLMKQGRKFTETEITKWWDQLVDALTYTHGKGIIHRDIKPSNLFLDESGHVKLLDFGIAKVKESISMTQTGAMIGTLLYMSPEQVQDSKHLDYKTDVYSLAVTFVHLLTGKAPYDITNSNDFKIRESIVYKPLDMTGVPANWQAFLAPYLEKVPEKRPELQPFGANASAFTSAASSNVATPSNFAVPSSVANDETVTDEKETSSRMPKPSYVTPMPKPYSQENSTKGKWKSWLPWLFYFMAFEALLWVRSIYELLKDDHGFDYSVYNGLKAPIYFAPYVIGISAFVFVLIKLIKLWDKKTWNEKIPRIISVSSLILFVLSVVVFYRDVSDILFNLLLVVAAGLAEAALFVYRPEKLNALPWIVLAVMGIVIVGPMGWNSYNFTLFHRHKPLLIACSISIVTLFALTMKSKRQEKP